MKQCSNGARHKWEFVRNVTIKRQTLRTIELSNRGLYKCACGETKIGSYRHVIATNGEGEKE